MEFSASHSRSSELDLRKASIFIRRLVGEQVVEERWRCVESQVTSDAERATSGPAASYSARYGAV